MIMVRTVLPLSLHFPFHSQKSPMSTFSDYGCNNGDKTYVYRTESANEYLNFFATGKSC